MQKSNFFAEVWERLDLYRLAELLPELTPKPRPGSNNLSLACPECKQQEAYLYPSRDGKGPRIHCNRRNNCGYNQSLFDYVKAREGGDGSAARRVLADAAGIAVDGRENLAREQVRRKFALPAEMPVNAPRNAVEPPVPPVGVFLPPPAELYASSREKFRSLPDEAPAVMYLRERGLTRDQADAAGIGYVPRWPSDKRPRLAYPLTDQAGAVVAVEGRYLGTPPGKETPKSLCHGPKKSGVFVPGGRFDPVDAHLCEGPFDAMALLLTDRNAMALCGTSLPSWLALALAFRPVYVATDADKAGDDAAARIVTELRPYGAKPRRFRSPRDGKDWGDFLQVGGPGLVSAACEVATGCIAPDDPFYLDAVQRLEQAGF